MIKWVIEFETKDTALILLWGGKHPQILIQNLS